MPISSFPTLPRPPSLYPLLLLCIITYVFTQISTRERAAITTTFSLQTPLLSYRVSTKSSPISRRCAIIRCSKPSNPRVAFDSGCAELYLDAAPTKNAHVSLCAWNYLVEKWDDLSIMYNEGIGFLNDTVHTNINVNYLPITSVHMISHTPYRIDPSFWWLVPTNRTHKFAQNLLRVAKTGPVAPVIRAIGCSGDGLVANKTLIQCHHRSLLSYNCANSDTPEACMQDFWRVYALVFVHLFAIVVCANRVWCSSLARRNATRRMNIGIGWMWSLMLFLVVFLVDWKISTKLLANMLALRYTTQLEPREFYSGDVYRAVPRLVGHYYRYAYMLRDGVQEIRIAGVGVSMCVAWIKTSLFLKSVLLNIYVIRLIAMICFVYMTVAALEVLTGSAEEARYVQEVADMVDRKKESTLLKDIRKVKGRKFVRLR